MMSEVGYTWPGLPVTCMVCLQPVVPTYQVTETRCGFVIPDHDWEVNRASVAWDRCPGSGAAVDRAVSATMATRIEEHVVSSMPPPHTPIDLTKRIHD